MDVAILYRFQFIVIAVVIPVCNALMKLNINSVELFMHLISVSH